MKRKKRVMKMGIKIKTKVVGINCSPEKFYMKSRRHKIVGKWSIRVKCIVLFNGEKSPLKMKLSTRDVLMWGLGIC